MTISRYAEQRSRVKEAVERLGECTPADVVSHLPDIPEANVRRYLSRLASSRDIQRVYWGIYRGVSND